MSTAACRAPCVDLQYCQTGKKLYTIHDGTYKMTSPTQRNTLQVSHTLVQWANQHLVHVLHARLFDCLSPILLVISDGTNRSAALACRLWMLRSRRSPRGPQSSPSSASLCALHPWAPQRVTGATSSLLGLYMEVGSTVSSSAQANFAATPPQLGEVSPCSTLKHV